MRIVTAGATDAVGQMLRLREILRACVGLVAVQTDGRSLRRSELLEADDLSRVATAIDVRLRRAVAALAAVLIAFQQRRMRSSGEVLVPNLLMTRLADIGLGILTSARRFARKHAGCWRGLRGRSTWL